MRTFFRWSDKKQGFFILVLKNAEICDTIASVLSSSAALRICGLKKQTSLGLGETMYFYEVIRSCDECALTDEFLGLCKNSPDLQHTREAFEGCLRTLKSIKPETDDKAVIEIEKITLLDGSLGDNVCARFEDDPEKYGLEINPWADTLGYRADEKSVSKYGAETFAALVIWEMTWFGFDEQSIQQRVGQWDEDR